MASSFYSNAQHVDFESVLSMDDHEMVSMFEALTASGLRGFLGCPAVVYEDALVDFFENASVRNGVVISTVDGQLVEISEALFAKSFELPVDGFGDLSEIPKDAIFDARSIVSQSGEQISLSGRKNQMKMPFRLLCDIMAKAISVKAGSFNAITVEKFSLMTVVVCGVKMNWAKYLFSILKKMVTAGSKQSKGFAVQISQLLATFPSMELGTGAVKQKAVSKKRPAVDVSAAVPKRRRTIKKKSVSSFSTLEMVAVAEEAVPLQQVEEPLDVEEPRCSSADAVDLIIQQARAADAPADTAEPAVSEEKNWFDLPYDDLVKQWEAERPVVTASDTEEDIATVDVAPADEVQQVQNFEAPISAEVTLSADEQMSLHDILLTIPVDIPLPSTCMEVTKITMGKSIKIPGVNKWTWFLKSLPCIPADDKGKHILVEKDPVKGNPAKEHYSLICADIELLVSLRAQVIDEVAKFFHSFSLRKLASINLEEMYKKEEQVLSWGETESPQEAIQRKFYIMLKYRTVLVWKFLDAWRANFAPGQGSSAVDIQVIELLSDLYLSFLEELVKEARAHNLTWTKPCCSKIFEGSPRDRGAVIARTNSNTRSLCWIRTMILVNGLWTVEPCADKWVKIPRKVVSTEVPRQRQYDDTLPTMSVFFKLLRKRWADVCVEVVGFCASPRLLPIGSTQFCRSLQLAEPVSSFAPSRSSVFALRVSQFCSVFIDLSLFNWLPSTDISEFLSSIALDRTILRSVQRSQDSFAVAPSVQLCLEQHQSSSSASDSSSSLHFDQTDVDATASSRPTISPDLSAVFADFQAALSEQIFASQSDISSRMHKLEQSVCDSLRDQADIFRNLSQGARQEVRTLDDVHTIRFNEFRKNVLTQNASIFQGLADVRQVMDAVNAKVYIMAKRLNDIQKDAEASKEALSHQLLEFQSSAQENHNVIHAQLSELVDYIHRGSADKKGESGSRGLQKPVNTQKEGSAVTPTFEQRVQMAQRRIVQTVQYADANRGPDKKSALSMMSTLFASMNFAKMYLTQNASVFQGLADVRQVMDAVNAKVYIMAKRLNDIQKDAEASKEALSHQLLEFQSSAQKIIIRGLQKPVNTQKEGSAVTPTFEQRVQMAQRRIVQTVLDADANRALLESQSAAERDIERRRKEAKSLKRRRRD
ncbi:hypothetical protein F511_41155 [Dorcoceras hygrometricum]|uniref:Dystroglycan-like n=1 Tax=Dorcoceras hygrometricum TaxID=472368 RepID=A0A2Z7ABR6_9LAMI|nr:hypothetical protein F511_41155 [Dorcoceras hygrometricum]